jgi:hypothetical protein
MSSLFPIVSPINREKPWELKFMPWEKIAEEFKDGDILYGLDEGRGAARDAILLARRQITTRVQFMCCFTRQKNYDRIVIQNSITNSVFDPAKPGLQSNEEIAKNALVKSDVARATGFKDFLGRHEKYSIANYVPGDSPNRAWLNASKAGLEYQAKREYGVIHFVLDGLDFKRVLMQNHVKDAVTARSVIANPGDITSAEIRFLFRRRADPDFTGKLRFWREGELVAAPWLSNENRYAFANFIYSKVQILSDEADSTEFKNVIRELKTALVLQRAFRARNNRYMVREGDNIASISERNNISIEALSALNPLVPIEPGAIFRLR